MQMPWTNLDQSARPLKYERNYITEKKDEKISKEKVGRVINKVIQELLQGLEGKVQDEEISSSYPRGIIANHLCQKPFLGLAL